MPTPPLPPPLEPVTTNAARWRAAIGSLAVILAGVLGYQVAPLGEKEVATIPCSCTCVFPDAVPQAPIEVSP